MKCRRTAAEIEGGGKPPATAAVDYTVVQVPDLDYYDAKDTDSVALKDGSLGAYKD